MGAELISHVQVSSGGSPLAVKTGVQSSAFDPGISNYLRGGDSKIHNSFIALNQQRPTGTFTSLAIKALLEKTNTVSHKIDASNPIEVYFATAADGATREATGNLITGNAGILVPDTLSANDGEVATISYRFVLGSEAGNRGFVLSTAATPTGVIAQMYKLGAVTIGGTSVGPVSSAQINFGANIQTVNGDGSVDPTLIYLPRQAPSITISTLNPDYYVAGKESGENAIVVVNLMALENGASVAATGHIQIKSSLNRIDTQSTGGSDGQEAGKDILVTPICDGTNFPLQYIEV